MIRKIIIDVVKLENVLEGHYIDKAMLFYMPDQAAKLAKMNNSTNVKYNKDYMDCLQADVVFLYFM